MHQTITIEYSAHQDFNFNKAFKPDVYINGKWIYTISRCKKTMRSAINDARKIAEEIAKTQYGLECKVTVKQKEI